MWILSPLSWLLASVLVFAVGALPKRRRGWLLASGIAGIVVSVAAMTPLAANLLVGWLEAMPEQPAACATRPPDVAVVLAGGVDRFARSEEDLSVLSIASRRRAEKAVVWWRERPGRELVVAGGSRSRRSVPEATLLAGYLEVLGVPASAIRTETRSLDTWQNAHYVAAIRPALPREIVLVTSAMHMRRAGYSMREAGFSPCVLGADWRYVPFQRLRYLRPDSGGLDKAESALHEIVGLVVYRIRHRAGGKTQAGGDLPTPPPSP